jgi:hypothetical protein
MFSLFATLPSCHVSKLPHHLLKLLSMNFLLAMSYNNMSWGCCSPKMNKLEQARLNGPLEPLSMLHTCSRAWQGCGQGRLLPSTRLLLPFALLLLCFALLACLLAFLLPAVGTPCTPFRNPPPPPPQQQQQQERQEEEEEEEECSGDARVAPRQRMQANFGPL